MSRSLAWVAVSIGVSLSIGTSATAATLDMVADRATYNVGDTLTLTISGAADGAAATGILGSVAYDPCLLTVVSVSQTGLTSFGGLLLWTMSPLVTDDPVGTVDAFDALAGPYPQTPDQQVVSTITFQWIASGVAHFSWVAEGEESLRFFGLTNAAGTSALTVGYPHDCPPIPEPDTASLLAFGLVGLAVRRSFVSPGRSRRSGGRRR